MTQWSGFPTVGRPRSRSGWSVMVVQRARVRVCEARGGGRARDDDTSDGGRGEGVVSTVGTLVCGRAGGSRSVHGRTVGAVRKTNAALMVVERRAEVHAFPEYPEGPATNNR